MEHERPPLSKEDIYEQGGKDKGRVKDLEIAREMADAEAPYRKPRKLLGFIKKPPTPEALQEGERQAEGALTRQLEKNRKSEEAEWENNFASLDTYVEDPKTARMDSWFPVKDGVVVFDERKRLLIKSTGETEDLPITSGEVRYHPEGTTSYDYDKKNDHSTFYINEKKVFETSGQVSKWRGFPDGWIFVKDNRVYLGRRDGTEVCCYDPQGFREINVYNHPIDFGLVDHPHEIVDIFPDPRGVLSVTNIDDDRNRPYGKFFHLNNSEKPSFAVSMARQRGENAQRESAWPSLYGMIFQTRDKRLMIDGIPDGTLVKGDYSIEQKGDIVAHPDGGVIIFDRQKRQMLDFDGKDFTVVWADTGAFVGGSGRYEYRPGPQGIVIRKKGTGTWKLAS